MKRRNFIKNASLSGVGLAVGNSLIGCDEKNSEGNPGVIQNENTPEIPTLPLVIATWNVKKATAKAWEYFKIVELLLMLLNKGA